MPILRSDFCDLLEPRYVNSWWDAEVCSYGNPSASYLFKNKDSLLSDALAKESERLYLWSKEKRKF